MRRAETQWWVRPAASSMAPAGIVGAAAMLGAEVLDREGSRIGELRDIMLDLRLGRVAYGIVAVGRGPTAGGRLKAVPWNAMHVDGHGKLKVNVPRDWMARAPSLEAGFEPSLHDHEWAEFIHAYFGARPYWERAAQHA
jgi:sporulation protein YlmC with PRC-barrel domain